MLAAALLVSACSMKKPAPSRVAEQRAIPSFTQMRVRGNIDVEFKTQQKTPQIYLYADSRDLPHIKTEIRNDTLNIVVDSDYPRFGPVMAKVDARFLNRLDYQGEGDVYSPNAKSALLDLKINTPGRVRLKGKMGLRNLNIEGTGKTIIQGINSRDLNIRMQGKPNIQLQGVANLRNLNFDGEGWLGLYWVSAKNLTIEGQGSAYVQLAGVVDTMHVNLHGHAHLNAKYLRAETAYVKTFEQSTADIQVLKNQNAVAEDQSGIYYYNDPPFNGTFMAHNGAVLEVPQNW